MAPDNVEITAGSGSPIRTDLVGTAHYQVVKLDGGGDGLAVPIVAGQQTKAASLPVTIASDQDALTVTGTFWQATQPVSIATAPALVASDAVIGLVGSSDVVVTVTPTLDTSAYSSGDLLFDSTEITNAVRANAGICILQSLTLLDKDDQGTALTLVFANAATDFGTLNSAPDPDDTECATILGTVEIVAGDYVDFGGARVATLTNLGLMMKAGAATTSLYVAAINGTSTPTHSAAGLVLQLAFIRS